MKDHTAQNVGDVDNKLVRMVSPPRPLMRMGNYRCNNCESIIQHSKPE